MSGAENTTGIFMTRQIFNRVNKAILGLFNQVFDLRSFE
jgi:hypothetical protein